MEYVQSQGVNVKFYMGAIPSQFKTNELGHPVVDEAEFIYIAVPGQQNTIIDTKVDETHKRRFPDLYKRFKDGAESKGISGWLLKDWPTVNTAQVAALEYAGVYTVEQLAAISDDSCQKIAMGTAELRLKAKAALNTVNNTAAAEKQASENKALRDEIDSMRQQFAAMQASMTKEDEPTKRGPGRPKAE